MLIASVDLLEWAKFFGTVFAPFIALAGAIWLFHLKQRADRADAARRDKRELFARFLGVCNEAWNEITNGPSSNSAGTLLIRAGGLASEIKLVADISLFEKATKFRLAMMDLWKDVCAMSRDEWLQSDGPFAEKKSRHISAIAAAEIDLVDAMRSDLSKP